MSLSAHPAAASERPVITERAVKAAQDTEPTSIGALRSAALRRIIGFYQYTGLDPDTAEDLTADTVKVIIAKLPTLRRVSSRDAWMSPLPPSPEEQAMIHEEHEQVARAHSILTLQDFELLRLREVLGLEYAPDETYNCTSADPVVIRAIVIPDADLSSEVRANFGVPQVATYAITR